MKPRCPVCNEVVQVSDAREVQAAKFFPFCSQQCKLIDLGAWLDAEYRIASESKPRNPTELANNG
ncbi:MAG: DNA gyrase inhibitor YacG [Planctomycetota bacterium]